MVNNRGSVLVVSIWMLIIASLLLLSVSYTVIAQMKLLGYYADDIQLDGAIHKGVILATRELKKDMNLYDSANEAWADNPAVFASSWTARARLTVAYTEDERTRYGLMDEERKININTAPHEILARIPGFNETIASAIIDWRDKDNDTCFGGAEANYYLSLQKPYACKNDKFEFIDELLLVRGINRQSLAQAERVITVYGNGQVNINTASQEVLRILGLTQKAQEAVIAYRAGTDGILGTSDDGIFGDSVSIAHRVTAASSFAKEDLDSLRHVIDMNMLTVHAMSYKAFIHAQLPNRARRDVEAVIDKKLGRIVYWHE